MPNRNILTHSHTLEICGYWVNTNTYICLVIERVNGILRATFINPDANFENLFQYNPIIEKDDKFYFDTEIGEVPFTYDPESDTIRTQDKYERLSNYLFTPQNQPE